MRKMHLLRHPGGCMKVVAILQARLSSTRLPGKVLMDLGGKPMVQHIIERVQRATKLDDIVLAVPSRDAADFAPLANGRAWLYAYSLDEHDLVGRYLSAAVAHEADIIVRIPCDNPCVDPVYVDAAIEDYLRDPVVYYSNTTALAGEQWVDGIGAEVCSRSRLAWLDQRTRGRTTLREHPHRYFEEQSMLMLPPAQIRLDVNTMQDYLFIADIYNALYPINPQFGIAEILAYLETKKATA